MFKKLLYLLLLIELLTKSQSKYKNYDYCTKTCIGPEHHTACGCGIGKDVIEMEDDVNKFRVKILARHNKFRQYVASGKARALNPAIESAADMHILNYDLELEYIANCLAQNFKNYNFTHDKCRDRYTTILPVGQNIASSSFRSLEEPVKSVDIWFDEIKTNSLSTNLIDKYNIHVWSVSHFIQVIWAKTQYVGCARAYDKSQDGTAYALVTVCNYASDVGGGGNVIGEPVYKRGTPCTMCLPNITCDNTYTALCGRLAPESFLRSFAKIITANGLFSFTIMTVIIFILI